MHTYTSIIRTWIVRSVIGATVYGAILFLSAGSLTWAWGWALLSILTASMLAPLLIFGTHDRMGVLAERAKGMWDAGVQPWDKRVTMLASGMLLLLWIVSGLDTRWQWTPPISIGVHCGGLLLTMCGYALFVWAMISNPFFAEGVRVHVARHGPYRYVRHPGYSGAILAYLATSLLTGSAWAFIPGVMLAILFIVRTSLEDRLLRAALPGYHDYTQHVRYRLVPGLW